MASLSRLHNCFANGKLSAILAQSVLVSITALVSGLICVSIAKNSILASHSPSIILNAPAYKLASIFFSTLFSLKKYINIIIHRGHAICKPLFIVGRRDVGQGSYTILCFSCKTALFRYATLYWPNLNFQYPRTILKTILYRRLCPVRQGAAQRQKLLLPG